MQARYLFTFRILLASTLLLYSLNAPGHPMKAAWIWAIFLTYITLGLAAYWLARTRRLNDLRLLFSFMVDIAITSFVLYLNGGFQSEFYVAYFLVILSTCFLENLSFSLIVGGVAILVYGYFAFPAHGVISPFYLLRSSLLLVTAFFSAYVAESARRIEGLAAERYATDLAWMQRLSIVGRAMSAVLHEAKTPLNTISLSAEQIRELARRGDKIDEPLDRIDQELEHVLAILNNFLDFSKPQPLQLGKLDVNLPLKRSAQAVRLHIQNRNIELKADLGQTAWILGSERHLVQAFTNIMLNAVQAMPLGGRLNVRKSVGGGFVTIEFSDTGTGMTKETIERLFEPFFTSKPESGHGLGLTVVRWVVDKHSGDLRVHSGGPGKGATITISIPLHIPENGGKS